MSRPLLLASLALALMGSVRIFSAEPIPAAQTTLGNPAWRHGGHIAALAFSPDGKRVASTSYDSPIRLWDVATGKQRRQFIGHERVVRQVGFSADGRTLFSAGWQDVRLWEISSGLERAKVGDPSVWIGPVAFSPDGKTAASRQNSRNDHRVRLSSIATGQMLHLLEGHTNGVAVMAFSNDGKTLATGSGDETIRLWDVASGKQLSKWTGHDKSPTVLTFSPDGKYLASYGFGSVRVWDVSAEKNVATMIVYLLASTQQLAFSPDGKTLAVAGRGVSLWDWSTNKVVRRMQAKEDITAVAFSPDGLTLATGPNEGPIRLWNVKTGEETTSGSSGHRRPITTLAYLNDGKTLATSSSDETIRFWDPGSGRELRKIEGLSSFSKAIAFSPDGRSVSAIQSDNQAGVWNTASGKILWTVPRAGPLANPAALTFTADGKLLAVSGHDGPVRLFDTATQKETSQIFGSKIAVMPLQFSPDGKYVAGFMNQHPNSTLLLTDRSPKGLTLRISAPRMHISQMAFSPDSRMLATFSENADPTFRLFETATGQVRLAARPHLNGMFALAFSPEGRYMATGGFDKTLVLWDLLIGAEVQRLTYPCAVTSLTWRPDGKVLAVGGADTLVRIYHREKLIPARQVVTTQKLADKVLEMLWADLGSPVGFKSYNAMRNLSIYSAQALALFEDRIPLMTSGKKIEQWIDELDSDAFATRERASEMLRKRLDSAEEMLRKALEGKLSAEKRKRIQALLKQVKPEEKPGKIAGKPELQATRAIEILERLGTPEAQKLLREWAKAKPPMSLSGQARESLQRMERLATNRDRTGKTSP